MLKKVKDLVIGKDKDPLDRGIFHQLSLVAVLAWVGLGADGLSSSAYGPEELYRALGPQHGHLALYLAAAMALTVFIISASYSQIIRLFPAGGGGYVVATKLLGPNFGVVSGTALVVDYILTISLSVAAGVDAIYSFLPAAWAGHKVAAGVLVLGFLIWLNLRGIKESIQVLLPIFLLFILTHTLLLCAGVFGHTDSLPSAVYSAVAETRQSIGTLGVWGFLILMLRAYSMGAGTYTGIEAVSNGMSSLREPRVQTGRRTMLYMAVSLSLVAGGLLLAYMLWDVPIAAGSGQTLNAVLSEKVMGTWRLGAWPVGQWLVYLTLLTEALLLFVAAQTGFVDGPTVLANMAMESWVPTRFADLSNRLVRLNGILFMGLTSLAILYFARGSVHVMIVLYAINVFITFTLSQLSMCRHWWQVRKMERGWFNRFLINGIGLVLTSLILVVTMIIKFGEGGWVTLLITGSGLGLCYLVKGHYNAVRKALERLDSLLTGLKFQETLPVPASFDPDRPTAVLMINGFNGLGIHSIFSIRKLFPDRFKNFVFLTVGRIDSSRFKGIAEIENLRQATIEDAKKYVRIAQSMGYGADYRYALGTDVLDELEELCKQIAGECPDVVFFSGKLIFARENFISKILHNQTALELQRRLLFEGHNMVIVPIRVM